MDTKNDGSERQLLQIIQQLWLSMLNFRRVNDNEKSYSISRHPSLCNHATKHGSSEDGFKVPETTGDIQTMGGKANYNKYQ